MMDVFGYLLCVKEMTTLTGPHRFTFLRYDLFATDLDVIAGVKRTIAEGTVLTFMMTWIVCAIRIRTDR